VLANFIASILHSQQAKDTIKQGKEKFFHFLHCSELIVTITIVIEDRKSDEMEKQLLKLLKQWKVFQRQVIVSQIIFKFISVWKMKL
jgi:hypothetical protein